MIDFLYVMKLMWKITKYLEFSIMARMLIAFYAAYA